MLNNISFNINDNSDPYHGRHTQTRFEIDVEVIRNALSYLCRKFKSVWRVDELTANKTTKQNYTRKAGSKLLEPQLVCVLVCFFFVFLGLFNIHESTNVPRVLSITIKHSLASITYESHILAQPW